MDLPVLPRFAIYSGAGEQAKGRTHGLYHNFIVNPNPKVPLLLTTALTLDTSVYAVLSCYLLVCSFWLTGKSFAVRIGYFLSDVWLFTRQLQNIPALLKNKTVGQVILTFFVPPVGALIAAMISTFGTSAETFRLSVFIYLNSPGIYFIASFLYVCAFLDSFA
jgi:hypothetical protein